MENLKIEIKERENIYINYQLQIQFDLYFDLNRKLENRIKKEREHLICLYYCLIDHK